MANMFLSEPIFHRNFKDQILLIHLSVCCCCDWLKSSGPVYVPFLLALATACPDKHAWLYLQNRLPQRLPPNLNDSWDPPYFQKSSLIRGIHLRNPPNRHIAYRFFSLVIPIAFCLSAWWKVMPWERILSFLASLITNKRVEYIRVSSDGFRSMIGRNFTDADLYTVAVCNVTTPT